MRTHRGLACCVGIALVLSCLLYLSRESWLGAMGRFLVDNQPPEHSDMIVVLGGDWYGNRILKAAELARQGFAPYVLVSGGGYLYGRYEGDLAVPFAVSHGYDEKIFIKLLNPVSSTAEEARAVIPELRRRGVKKYIIVTTQFHSRRAGEIFRHLAPDLNVRVASPPDTLHWNNWWTERESRKTFLLEWTKTLTATLGI
jgi:uncharacterized SAM-binding protein YcdF (DUF218 family)